MPLPARITAALTLAAAAVSAQKFLPVFKAPSGTWITQSTESIRKIDFPSGTLPSIQAALDAERSAYPEAVILITVSGQVAVTTAPLKLPSLTCLLLMGEISAAPGATASGLIFIDSASRVSISGGQLDGGGQDLHGILVRNSGKVNLDNIQAVNFRKDGIRFEGMGNTAFQHGSSITRCRVSRSGGNGIWVGKATQVVLMDNILDGNTGAGIVLEANHGIAFHNVVVGPMGMMVAGAHNLITGNTIGSARTGISFLPTANNNLVIKNSLAGNDLGIALEGENNVVLENTMSNKQEITGGGKDNFLVPRNNAFAAPAGSNKYFNPPTVRNRHALGGIVAGRTRVDITAASGSTLAQAQTLLNDAHAKNPTAFVVLNLKGDFTTAKSLLVPSYTSILLEGTLKVTDTVAGILGNSAQFVSVSGGTVSGGLRSIEFLGASKQVILDSVHATGSSSDGIHFKGTSYTKLGSPVVVMNSLITKAGRRALWGQVLTQMVVLDNRITGAVVSDGIDIDSHCGYTYSLGNVMEDNRRYGIFFEEGAKYNVALANAARRNAVGINNMSYAVGPTNFNMAVGNLFEDNVSYGIRMAGRESNRTDSSYFFNNAVTGSSTHISVQNNTQDNHLSQNVATTYGLFTEATRFTFFNPPLAPYDPQDLPTGIPAIGDRRAGGPKPRFMTLRPGGIGAPVDWTLTGPPWVGMDANGRVSTGHRLSRKVPQVIHFILLR